MTFCIPSYRFRWPWKGPFQWPQEGLIGYTGTSWYPAGI